MSGDLSQNLDKWILISTVLNRTHAQNDISLICNTQGTFDRKSMRSHILSVKYSHVHIPIGKLLCHFYYKTRVCGIRKYHVVVNTSARFIEVVVKLLFDRNYRNTRHLGWNERVLKTRDNQWPFQEFIQLFLVSKMRFLYTFFISNNIFISVSINFRGLTKKDTFVSL